MLIELRHAEVVVDEGGLEVDVVQLLDHGLGQRGVLLGGGTAHGDMHMLRQGSATKTGDRLARPSDRWAPSRPIMWSAGCLPQWRGGRAVVGTRFIAWDEEGFPACLGAGTGAASSGGSGVAHLGLPQDARLELALDGGLDVGLACRHAVCLPLTCNSGAANRARVGPK